MALEQAKAESKRDETYYHGILITIMYNMARLHEDFREHDRAEVLYKNILRQHPNYIDCMSFMRERDRTAFTEATRNVRTLLLIGHLPL